MEIYFNGTTMFESEFRAQFPNTSLPQQLTEEVIKSLGGDVVFEGPQASGGDHYQYSQRQGVEQIIDAHGAGKWYTKYVLGPVFTDNEEATAAEQEAAYKAMKDTEQAKNVRDERTRKLAETDWRFRSDMTPSQAWIDYCVALRNVPEQAGFPWSVEWPTEPQ